MNGLAEFKAGLDRYLVNPYARPFVCDGSPFLCRSFIVGLNAATCLPQPFSCYWTDDKEFLREKFRQDYAEVRLSKGNRPVIEAISAKIGACLETNLYAVPSRTAIELTDDDRKDPVIEYLFRCIKPRLVFVHSNKPICFFRNATRCDGFTTEIKQARWQEHDFLLFGRPGPLYTLGRKNGAALGTKLAERLGSP